MDNVINISTEIKESHLSRLFSQALDDAIDGTPFETNGVVIKLTRIGEADVNPEGSTIDMLLPVRIEISRPAGLFSVEGSGSLVLNFAIEYDITPQMYVQAHSSIRDFEWIERPELEIGSLTIPVEKLVDMVLKYQESIITGKIDAQIKKLGDLNQLLQDGLVQVRHKLAEIDTKGNNIYFDVNKLRMTRPFRYEETHMVNADIHADITVNAPIPTSNRIAFEWMENSSEYNKNQISVPIVLGYDLLKEGIRVALRDVDVAGQQFSIVNLSVYGGEKLNIEMDLAEPIKAQVFVSARPIFNEIEGELKLDAVDVKVNPSNLIYKLTAPIVNRVIEGKISDQFPLNIVDLLNEKVQNQFVDGFDLDHGKLLIRYKDLSLSRLKFENTSIDTEIVVQDLFIDLVIT